jgi:hypothetical protein
VGHVAHGDMRKMYKILVKIPQGNIPFRGHVRQYEKGF